MKRAAVLLAEGFEEVEALTVVDMLRRLDITCDMAGVSEKEVTGSHGIKLTCDRLIGEDIAEYDAVILPGGLPGAANLRDNEEVTGLVKKMYEAGKTVAAICAAPIVLERAGVIEGKAFTAYPGFGERIEGGIFKEDIVVKDGNLITSRGPATAFEFVFAIAEALGADTKVQRDATLYDRFMRK